MNFWFCFGTAGELIKLYPLMKFAHDRKLKWYALSTGQSGVNLKKQWDDFSLPEHHLLNLIETNSDLNNNSGALKWFLKAILKINTKTLKEKTQNKFQCTPTKNDQWFIHGDTLSTYIGARIGHKLKLKVSHIEAGLRSESLLEPFPEEISRRLVSRLCFYHFCQDKKAEENLKKAKVKGEIINTNGNTLIDALNLVLELNKPVMQNEKYIIANLHRFENLNSKKRWKILVDTLILSSKKYGKIKFVLHAPAEAKINSDPINRARLLDAGVELIPRLPFSKFAPLLKNSEYVISDGGSNQEECYYLGKPCLILRESTERQEGLKSNCVLSMLNKDVIHNFIENPSFYKRESVLNKFSPSNFILDTLINKNNSAHSIEKAQI